MKIGIGSLRPSKASKGKLERFPGKAKTLALHCFFSVSILKVTGQEPPGLAGQVRNL